MIAEARVWLVRHGGRLFSAAPFLLAALDDVTIVPEPPQAAMFHALVRR